MKKLLLFAFVAFFFTTTFGQNNSAPTVKQLQDIEKFMAPYRKKVTDILEADKTGQYPKYLADLNDMVKARGIEKKLELAQKLTANHYSFIKASYQKAVINHEEMRAGIARILGHNNFQLGEFGDIFGDFTLPGAIVTKFFAELNCPLEASQEQTNQALLAFCTSDVTTCNIDVESTGMYDGGCRSKGSLGDNVELPEQDFNKISVEAQFNLRYDGIAMALAGYGQANVKIGLRLQAPGIDKVVITKDVWCIAPVIWYKTIEGSIDDYIATVDFTGAFHGGDTITAQVYNETYAICLPLLNAANTECRTAGIDHIRIAASN